MYKARKKKIKPRFFIMVTLIVAVIVGGAVFLLKPKQDALMTMGVVNFSLDTRVAMIRDESAYTAKDKYNRVVFHTTEGAQVVAGAPVMRTYRWGYTDDIMQALFDVQAEILQAQLDFLAGIDVPELNSVNATIGGLMSEAERLQNGRGDSVQWKTLLEIETELKQAITERTALLLSKTQAPEELVRLYNSETAALRTVTEWASEIVAAQGGRVSFYSDGFEQSLNASKLDLITATLIQQALKSTGTASANDFVYKIVNDEHWYVAFLTKDSSPVRVTPGESYTVTFRGYESTPYTGKAVSANESDGSIINVLEFNKSMGDFLSTRSLQATLQQEFTGLQVSKQAISVVKGEPEITVMQYGVPLRVQVDVLAINGDKAIIRAKDSSEAIYDGQRYIIP